MKLVKQKTLYFSDSKSDKVYEVDLCESDSDLFIVNFRYGRRGKSLREGTKTVFPVPFGEAEKIYNKLIASKEKKGYAELGEAPKTETSSEVVKPKANTAKEETILTYLKEIQKGTYTRNWKISRIILRTIALEMTDAVELVKPLLKSKDLFEQYNTILALEHFKDHSEIETIFGLFKKHLFTNIVGRLAASYLIKNDAATYLKAIQDEVPNTISFEGNFITSLAMYFMTEGKNEKPKFGKENTHKMDASVIYYAYIKTLDNKELQKELFHFIDQTPLKVNTFKSIRYIYRTAEFLNDIPFLTLLSKRIAISKYGYSSTAWDVWNGKKWIYPYEEKIKKNPSIAFSSATKAYFDKYTYKLVFNYSKNNTDNYIQYATGLLTSLNDNTDNQKEFRSTDWDYVDGNWVTEYQYYPKYNNFLALMYIVYGNSPHIKGEKQKYFIKELSEINATRNEILSEVWNTKPNEILSILADGKSDIAISFALRILNDNPQFLEAISDELLFKFLNHSDGRVLGIVLPKLKEKYKATQPEENVLFAVLTSENDEAKKIGFEWLTTYQQGFFTTKGFISKLVLLNKTEIIAYLKALYKTEVAYNTPFNLSEINVFFDKPDDFEQDYLFLVNELIGETKFGVLLSETSKEAIHKLASSDILTNKLFAINLATHNKLSAFELFKNDYDSYINADEKILRVAGIRILSHFPDEFLLENKFTITKYCFSEHQEVREAIDPTIERLLQIDADFKATFLTQLLNIIIEEEEYNGIHESSYNLLVKYYDKKLSSVTTNGILSLVLSDYDFAQKLGTPLYKERVVLKDLSMEELVAISNSAVLEIRENLHQFFKDNVARINYELEDALRIFNSKWQDVIDWGCDFFGEHIESKNWTIDILLYVSDHTKKDVEAFGRKMITTHFSKDKGLPLLLKLQEHPTKAMQFFVTNYLDTYATDNVDVILKLESFFKTSLFNINTNRATKTRIYAFLKQETVKSETVAKMAIKIINSVLGTKTKMDQSNNIDLLLAIVEAHPNLEVPLTIKSV